jgi:hypothetical protein
MAREPKLPKSYEYSTDEAGAQSKSSARGLISSKFAAIASTSLLAVIGVVGGVVLVNNLNAPSPLDQPPAFSGAHNIDGKNQTSPGDKAPGQAGNSQGSSGTQVMPTHPGDTIAVPPVTFNDDGDTRQFHDYDDGHNTNQQHIPGAGGNHHKPYPSVAPSATPAPSKSPWFSNNGSNDSNDDSGSDN